MLKSTTTAALLLTLGLAATTPTTVTANRPIMRPARHSNTESSYYAPSSQEQSYGYDYCATSFYPEDSGFGYPYCSHQYSGGYEYNYSDCLEYGYECGKSCVRKGGVKCYGEYGQHQQQQQQSTDYYTTPEPAKEKKQEYLHRPQSAAPRRHYRVAPLRHANNYYEQQQTSYYTPQESYHQESYYGGDYCSTYSASWSEYGFPYCSTQYTGGYEYNHSDCLEYGYECGQSCVKQGSKKCEVTYYDQEQPTYYHEEQQPSYYHQEQQQQGYYY
ncbi:hypothetical protein HK102_000671 [Quaeritorhiza haematococci]|nr:hypothetical protein HK102_000671 [Quaeritorhiza haematococci]